MTATYQPTAEDAYCSAQATARDLLAALAEILDQHHYEVAHGTVHWGHVEDLGYVNAQLADLLSVMQGES